MSYKYNVINSKPLAYYPLTFQLNYGVLLSDFDTYSEYANEVANYGTDIPINNFFDEIRGYATAQTGSVYTVTNDVLAIVSRRLDDSTKNACKITDSSQLTISNHYNMFVKGYENAVFGIEFWTLVDSAPTEKITFFKSMDYNNAEIIEIYALKDSIYFEVSGLLWDEESQMYNMHTHTVSKQVYTWGRKMHVFACYSERTIDIAVNGLSDGQISMDNSFMFSDDEQHSFKIGPAPTGKDYTISDIALYDRDISQIEIRSRLLWASQDASPEGLLNQGSASYFPVYNQGGISSSKSFNYASDYNLGYYSNLIPDNSGITIQKTESASQLTGTWTYNFPITSYENFKGLDISWDTASSGNVNSLIDYVAVFASYDGGENYVQVANNKPVPLFLQTASDIISSRLMVKVEIYSSDTSKSKQPRLDNLLIKLYRNIDVISDSGMFNLSPFSSQTYSLKNDNSSVIDRYRNLGINFAPQGSTVSAGTARIYANGSDGYRSMEFWFRYEGQGSAIIDSTSSANPELYIQGGQFKTGSATVYINGIDVTGTNKIVSVGSVYHIVIVWPTLNTNEISVNGQLSPGTLVPCTASYGFISLFPSILTQTEVENRYLSYLTINSVKVQSGNNSIGSIVEYYGSETSFNNGQAVIAYRHLY